MKRILLSAALLALLFAILSAACASAAEIRPIEINPEEIDLNNGEFCLSIRDEDQIVSGGFFTAELFLEDRYDGDQIRALAPGDTVWMNGVSWTVEEIVLHTSEYPGEEAVYEVYPAEEYYGYLVFSPNGDGTFRAVIDDWVPVTPVGEIRVMLPLPDAFSYVSISGGEEDAPAGPDAFLEDLGMFGGFNRWNTTCEIKDGMLMNILHSSYPWGPEDYWPGEEDAVPEASDDSDDSDDSGDTEDTVSSEEIPVWKFFHAVSADPLETAVITGSTTDCEEGPVPFEIGEDEAEEIRALAMYGVVTGRVNEMMVTGGTWLYTFETPEGEYLMTVEMYQGLLVGNDGMYSFRILRDGDE